MNGMRSGGSWQIILADLSLILFIAVAAAVQIEPITKSPPTGRSVPTDVNFSSRMTGDGLHEWLVSYPADPRERLEIVIDYAPDGLEEAIIRIREMRAVAGEAGHQPRIILQPNSANGVSASFAFDAPPALARNLQ